MLESPSRGILKSHLINIAKIAFSATLIIWLVRSDRLNIGELTTFVKDPFFMLLSVLGWASTILFLGAVRWYVLLRGVGLIVEFYRVLSLHFIGLFFNAAMPGAVGGDIIKAVYVVRDVGKTQRIEAMVTVLVDRVVGLMAMFLMGGIAFAFDLIELWAMTSLRPVLLMLMLGCVGSLIAVALILVPSKGRADQLLEKTKKWGLVGRFIAKPYGIFRDYRRSPGSFMMALFLSVLIQSSIMAYFYFLTTSIEDKPFSLNAFLTIYPVGMLITAIPLAPSGLGVGHAAFSNLYRMIGLARGADVFNVYVLLAILFNLTGVIPYLMLRKREGLRLDAALDQSAT